MSNENQTGTASVSLWNPNVAANWSLLFSPIFGAWLHAKNWSVLGDERKAKQSMYWVYGGIVIFILVILSVGKRGSGASIWIVYLFSWYFLSAKQQAKYVKEKLNNVYEKKGWAKPIGIGIVGLVAYFLVAVVAVTNFNSDFQQESALTDVSGVWRADQDGAMTTLKLEGKMKSIDINGKYFPVAVKSYDDENKIITLVVNNNPAIIWTVRQIFDKEGKFTLNFTMQDGTQDNLSFVRNL